MIKIANNIWTRSPVVYDAAAKDLFARVKAAGGDYNNDYGSEYSMRAISDFCVQTKDEGTWDSVVEFSLFGVATGLAGILQKLKYHASAGAALINPGSVFVSGDYTAVNTGMGLKGNGSTKYLQSGFAQNLLTASNRGLFAYEVERDSDIYKTLIGSDLSVDDNLWALINSSGTEQSYWGGAVTEGAADTGATGFWHGVNDTSTSTKLYRNGVLESTQAVSAATPQNITNYIFALNRADSAIVHSASRLAVVGVSLTMSDAQALVFYNAVQTLMTKFGGQV